MQHIFSLITVPLKARFLISSRHFLSLPLPSYLECGKLTFGSHDSRTWGRSDAKDKKHKNTIWWNSLIWSINTLMIPSIPISSKLLCRGLELLRSSWAMGVYSTDASWLLRSNALVVMLNGSLKLELWSSLFRYQTHTSMARSLARPIARSLHRSLARSPDRSIVRSLDRSQYEIVSGRVWVGLMVFGES